MEKQYTQVYTSIKFPWNIKTIISNLENSSVPRQEQYLCAGGICISLLRRRRKGEVRLELRFHQLTLLTRRRQLPWFATTALSLACVILFYVTHYVSMLNAPYVRCTTYTNMFTYITLADNRINGGDFIVYYLCPVTSHSTNKLNSYLRFVSHELSPTSHRNPNNLLQSCWVPNYNVAIQKKNQEKNNIAERVSQRINPYRMSLMLNIQSAK